MIKQTDPVPEQNPSRHFKHSHRSCRAKLFHQHKSGINVPAVLRTDGGLVGLLHACKLRLLRHLGKGIFCGVLTCLCCTFRTLNKPLSPILS